MENVTKTVSPAEVTITEKPEKGIVENILTFDKETPVFAGCALVRIDKPETGLLSWRLRLPGGFEIRLTVSPKRATQTTRVREAACHYVMYAGAGYCVTRAPGGALKVDMAVAGTDEFVLSIPGGIDYVVITSEGSAFSFEEGNRTVSDPSEDELYKEACALSEKELTALSERS